MDTWVVSASLLLWIMLHWMWGADISLRYWFHFLWIYIQKRDCWIIRLFHFLFFEEHPWCFSQWLHQFMFLPTVYKKFLNGPQGPVWSETRLPIPPQLISLHLNSPQLTSPAWGTKLWPHVRAAILPRYFYSPHLSLILFRDAFLYLSLFCFPYYYYTLFLQGTCHSVHTDFCFVAVFMF